MAHLININLQRTTLINKKTKMIFLFIMFLFTNFIIAGSDVEVKGKIEDLGDNYLQVKGLKFFVDSSTEFEDDHNSSFGFSSLELNQTVEVEGKKLNNSGDYFAEKVKLEDMHEDEFEIEGTVESKGDNYISVAGFVFYVNENTKFVGEHHSAFSFSLLNTGDKVEVKAIKNPDSSFTATKIKLEDEDDDNELEFKGTISEIGDNNFTIGNRLIQVNESTIILGHSNSPLSFEDLTTGMRVEVKAIWQSGGTLLATKIKIEDHSGYEDEIEFTAQIESIDGTSLVVGGVVFKVDSNTVVLDNNRQPVSFESLRAGMLVKIKGFRQADGSILAVKIKIEDFYKDEIELKGKIEDLGSGFVTVLGKTFTVNDQTKIYDHLGMQTGFSSLSAGMIVEIKGKMNSAGVLIATKIKIEDEDDFEISGTITALYEDKFELGGSLISVNQNTLVLNHQSQPVSYSDLTVGMFVEVKLAKNPDGSFIAIKIKIEDSPGLSKLSGVVTNHTQQSISVSNINFKLAPDVTVLDYDFTKIDYTQISNNEQVIVWTEKSPAGGNNVFQIQVMKNSVTGIKNDRRIEPEFTLRQNYPNPFNPSTVITFNLIKQANVSLAIYNAIGEIVRTLLNENLTAGNYKITFDARGLTSGIYFYSLKVNNTIKTKKMILLR